MTKSNEKVIAIIKNKGLREIFVIPTAAPDAPIILVLNGPLSQRPETLPNGLFATSYAGDVVSVTASQPLTATEYLLLPRGVMPNTLLLRFPASGELINIEDTVVKYSMSTATLSPKVIEYKNMVQVKVPSRPITVENNNGEILILSEAGVVSFKVPQKAATFISKEVMSTDIFLVAIGNAISCQQGQQVIIKSIDGSIKFDVVGFDIPMSKDANSLSDQEVLVAKEDQHV